MDAKRGKALDNSTVKGTGQTEGHSKSRMTFICFSVKEGRECDFKIDYIAKQILLFCVYSHLRK